MTLRRARLVDALDIGWWALRVILLSGAIIGLVAVYLAVGVKVFRAILNG